MFAVAKHWFIASSEVCNEFSWIYSWFPWQGNIGFHNSVEYFQITTHLLLVRSTLLHTSGRRRCFYLLYSTDAEFFNTKEMEKYSIIKCRIPFLVLIFPPLPTLGTVFQRKKMLVSLGRKLTSYQIGEKKKKVYTHKTVNGGIFF